MLTDTSRAILESERPLSVTVSPYTYVRTSVMASKLLTKMQYHKLIKMTLPEIGQFLEETSYKREIDELARSEGGVQLIEHAVQRNFWRAVDKLRRISDDKMRFLIDVYVWRNDIQNFKTLLRAKHANEDIERIKNILLPGTFTKQELLDLYALPGVEALLAAVHVPFAEGLSAIYHESGLPGVEDALTEGYYRATNRIARRIKDERDLFRQFLLLEVDVTNILTVLKLKRKNTEKALVEKLLINAYGNLPENSVTIRHRFRRHLFAEFAGAADMEEALKLLAASRFGDIIAPGADAYRKNGSLLEMERELQSHLLRRAMTLGHQHPLSADTVMAFLFGKVVETRNIMMIIKGKELGVSEEFLEQELVVR